MGDSKSHQSDADEAGKTITGTHRPAVYHRFIAAGKGAIPE